MHPRRRHGLLVRHEDALGERLILQQKVFIERAERAVGMGDSDLEHPEVGARSKTDIGQRPVVVGGVGEFGETVTGEVEVQLPAEVGGRILGVVVELSSGDALVEPDASDVVPDGADVSLGPVVVGVVAEDESISGVTFTLLEDRTDVDEEDVVLLEHHARLGAGHEILGRVGATTHDDVMPTTAHSQ